MPRHATSCHVIPRHAQALIKHTPVSERGDLLRACELIADVAVQINSRMRSEDNHRHLLRVQRMIRNLPEVRMRCVKT